MFWYNAPMSFLASRQVLGIHAPAVSNSPGLSVPVTPVAEKCPTKMAVHSQRLLRQAFALKKERVGVVAGHFSPAAGAIQDGPPGGTGRRQGAAPARMGLPMEGPAMSFRFTRRQSVGKAVRRIARQEIRKAIRDLATADEMRHIGIHESRKRLKKLRSLLRLVKEPMGRRWTPVDTLLRDVGRGLAAARDAEAMVEALDSLLKDSPGKADPFASMQTLLADRRDELTSGQTDLSRQMDDAAAALASLGGCIGNWRLGRVGFATISASLKRCYAKARGTMLAAWDSGDSQHFHQWRKCVKHHGHHVRLLRHLWRPVMDARCGQLDRLGELLGQDHDLAALRTVLTGEDRFAHHAALPALLLLIDDRQAALRAEAHELGMRLFAEKPGKLRSRFARYWKAWRRGRKPPQELRAATAVLPNRISLA